MLPSLWTVPARLWASAQSQETAPKREPLDPRLARAEATQPRDAHQPSPFAHWAFIHMIR